MLEDLWWGISSTWLEPAGNQIDADNPWCTRNSGTLSSLNKWSNQSMLWSFLQNWSVNKKEQIETNCKANSTKAKDCNSVAFLWFCNIHSSAKTCHEIPSSTHIKLQPCIQLHCIRQVIWKVLACSTCWESTAHDADFVKGCFRVNLGQAPDVNHSVFTEGGCSQKMVNGLAVDWESCFAIMKHHSPVSVNSEEIAHVALLW